ncbi:hypothetical protein THRCLA_04300 [Thraustotheca clavata]|uniref:Uncharacterized protein n=1 Tax=Thraustotheca clavata TaxID=74557 RepID=A0A1V9ZZK6_9STRA|nr:hypothetical protein THRCLA_04300 [Thraustotheca clavata]
MEIELRGTVPSDVLSLLRGLVPLYQLQIRMELTDEPLKMIVRSHLSVKTCNNYEELLQELQRVFTWKEEDKKESMRLFIAGDKSQVGKSTTCMALLGALLQLGYQPHELAYIKPATQCEAPQMISSFCEFHGIDAVPIGPVVFYSGFTRAFIEGNDRQEASKMLLEQIQDKVNELSLHKRIVLIDGVGYPSVGSICGVSNAQVATALAPISVVLVGKAGVGDAVDSFNLNATYFKHHGVRVLGGIFNKLPLEGYYSLENCKAIVSKYFEATEYKAYGFVPQFTMSETTTEGQYAHIINNFTSSVNVQAILDDARAVPAQKQIVSTITIPQKRPLSPLPLQPQKKSRPLTIKLPSRSAIQAKAALDGAIKSS